MTDISARELDQLLDIKAAAKKLMLGFPEVPPDDGETIDFNIPKYVVDELKDAIKLYEGNG